MMVVKTSLHGILRQQAHHIPLRLGGANLETKDAGDTLWGRRTASARLAYVYGEVALGDINKRRLVTGF